MCRLPKYLSGLRRNVLNFLMTLPMHGLTVRGVAQEFEAVDIAVVVSSGSIKWDWIELIYFGIQKQQFMLNYYSTKNVQRGV